MKERNGINELNKVCKAVLKLTDEDFSEMETIANDQLAFFSPLRMATMGRQRELGKHNLEVLAALKTLREIIKQGANI